MNKRTIDEMIAYFNQEVSNMDIAREYKMKLLGLITAIGYESKKQEVVRCNGCKHWQKRYKSDGVWLGECDMGFKLYALLSENFFCADGKSQT